ncbi:MAG: hypothetical protein JXD19_02355 [Deltaproteobacteria bacterium]|nr:hypothetical protein [Deltaproteobacteria bacterium]
MKHDHRASDTILNNRFSGCALAVLVFGIALFLFACGLREHCVGTYVAAEEVSGEHGEAVIELNEDGQGVWRVQTYEVFFRWSVKKNEVRLHTKEGGVIIGEMRNGTLYIELPGTKTVVFKKSPGY